MTKIQQNNGVTTVSKKDAKAQAKKAELEAKKALEEKGKTIYQQAIEKSESRTTLGVRSDVKDELKEMYKAGIITKEEYKAARKEGGFGFFRRNFWNPKAEQNDKDYTAQAKDNQHALDSKTEDYYMTQMSKSNATTEKGVRKDVRSAIKADQTLSADERKNALKQTSRGNWFRQAAEWTGEKAKKDANQDFKTQAAKNRRAQTEDAIISGDKKLSAKSQALVDKMGLSYEDLYAIGDDQFGSDATDNYSYKKRQVGETEGIMGTLTERTKEAGGKFEASEKEVKELYRELGYDVESKIIAGHVFGGAVKGAAAGATGFINSTHIKNLNINKGVPAELVHNVQKQNVKTVPVGILTTAVGAAIGAGIAIDKDIKRVEARVGDKEVQKDIKTLEQFKEYAKEGYTEKGADIMTKIAEKYTNEDGTLKIDQMNAALHKAAGDNSVLNYQEARSLYANILSGKEKIEDTVVVPPEDEPVVTPCEIEDLAPTVDNKIVDDTSCYKVKKGDNWYLVAEGKYNVHGDDLKAVVRQLKDAYFEANKDDLKQKGVKSSRDGFFPNVGKELCLPSTVTVNGRSYEYKEDATVAQGKVGGKYKGATLNAASNPFLRHETETTYRAQDCNNTIYESKESQQDARAKAEAAQRK